MIPFYLYPHTNGRRLEFDSNVRIYICLGLICIHLLLTLLLLVLSAGSTSRVVDSINGTRAATH